MAITSITQKSEPESISPNAHLVGTQTDSDGKEKVYRMPVEKLGTVHTHALAGITKEDIDLTACTMLYQPPLEEGYKNPVIEKKKLSGSPGKFFIDIHGHVKFSCVFNAFGFIYIGGKTVYNFIPDTETTGTFEYDNIISENDGIVIEVRGGDCTFNYFNALAPKDGFMTSSDKAKLDSLPDESGNEFYADDEFAVGEGNKLGTRGFEIISYSGTQGESGTYMVRGTENDYNALKAVFDTGEELYITILNKENKDSWCKITAVSFVNGNIVITVDNMYTNSESASYDASATYSETGLNTSFPELGWTIQQREAGNADWQKQACFFICGYPEFGTFTWFGSQSAFGDGNILQNKTSAIVGLNNRAYGKYNFIAGKNNKAGYNSHVFGEANDVSKSQSVFTAGIGNKAEFKGSNSAMFGAWLEAIKKDIFTRYQFITGTFNKNRPLNVFEVGGGTSDTNRANIFEVDRYGQVFANEKFLPLQRISQQNTTFSVTERAQKITDVSQQISFRLPNSLNVKSAETNNYGPYVYADANKTGLTVGKWYVMVVGFTNYLDEWNVSINGFCKNAGENEKQYLFSTGGEISVPKGESHIIIPIYVAKSDSLYGFYCDRNTRSVTLNSVEIYEAKDIGLSYKFADRFPDNIISNEVPVEIVDRSIITKLKNPVVSELPKCYTICDSTGKCIVTAPLSENTESAAYGLYTGNGYLDGLKAEVTEKTSAIEFAAHKHETDSKIDLLSLKAEKNGEALRISDACEWEQTADVSIASKNLIPYPYTNTTTTYNGVTYTVGTDGSITVNGTVGSNIDFSYFIFVQGFPLITGKYYTLSGCPQNSLGGKANLSIVNPSNGVTIDGSFDTGSGVSFKLTTELTNGYACMITIKGAGTTVENLVFKPQLELGTQATAYTPHVSDISSVSVKKYGKNLIPYLYVSSTKTVNGLTFTDNGNGSITVNGTPTGFADFTLAFVPVKPGQTYTLFKNQTGANNISFVITEYFNQSTQKAHTSDSSQNTYTFTTSENTNKLSVAIKRTKDDTACTGTFKPQLELGNAATDYELYKAPVTYTPDSDGKVSGVTLGSDTATLTTDTGGVIINAKYKKDITKAFEELETKLTNAILSNGGNI